MSVRELPLHKILDKGPVFLHLRVEHRTYEKQAQYRVVLAGDAQTKEITDWSASYTGTVEAFKREVAGFKERADA